MGKRADQAERSRAVLIEAAAQALVEGQGHFELQDVARRAGVSVGLPYHRFGSKAGLVAAVVEHFYDEIEAVITLADVQQLDWAEREQVRLSRLIGFLYGNPLAAQNIRKGQQRGQLPTAYQPEILSAMICGGLRHAVGQALASSPRPSRPQLTRQLWNFIINGLQLNAIDTSKKKKLPTRKPSKRGT